MFALLFIIIHSLLHQLLLYFRSILHVSLLALHLLGLLVLHLLLLLSFPSPLLFHALISYTPSSFPPKKQGRRPMRGTGGTDPLKFEVEDGPCIRPSQYFEK